MRPVLIPLLLFLLNCLLAGPIPIQPITHESHEVSYYVDQKGEWEQIAKSGGCEDPMSWYHYYLAAHFSNLFGHEPAFDLGQIMNQAENALTESDFALHYLRCRRAKGSDARWKHLLAAYAAEPERPESYPGLAIYYLLEGDHANYQKFMRMLDARMPFPNGAMEWSYNQLASVAKDGVLLTHGDNDTYATLLLQAVYGIRPDVEIINLSLYSFFADYRERISKSLGIVTPVMQADVIDAEAIVAAMVTGKRSVHLGVGAHNNLISKLADRMYLTGLTYRYADTPFNNLGTLVNTYRNNWRLDELHQTLASGPAQRVADELNRNYLPALVELHQHFSNSDPKEAAKIETTVRSIALRNGLENSIDQFLQPEVATIASEKPGLKAKQIAKSFLFIPAGIYKYRTDETGNSLPAYPSDQGTLNNTSLNAFWLQESEVSNADYHHFLQDLLRQRRFDLLEIAAIAEADYNAFLPEDQRDPATNSLYRERSELLYNHPVTNISYQAAELYAQWLSEAYNQDPKRKDGRNVRFRLPTSAELGYAARGGREFTPFPWGGPMVANAKGCFLANFNTTLIEDSETGVSLWKYADKAKAFSNPDTEENCSYTSDGGFLTVPVRSYFPNDYGIYNLSGNAAEMTDKAGIDVGGSWADHAAAMEIGRQQQRATPHPAVGFRLIMEYLD